MKLESATFGDPPIKAYYRPASSDERALKEVFSGTYRKLSIGFDVQPDEHWLDLGANIGAFALYCVKRCAVATCYEADKTCFELLCKNVPQFVCHNQTVAATQRKVDWYKSQNVNDHSRGTFVPSSKSVKVGALQTVELDRHANYDGIKMDIEGAEGELIDEWSLPKTDKLVLEYHSSRDLSVGNFRRRLARLRSKFKVVSYPAELDRILASGATKFERWIDVPALSRGGRFVQWPMADRLIFCKGTK
jgi:FkbM family methyltransferase